MKELNMEFDPEERIEAFKRDVLEKFAKENKIVFLDYSIEKAIIKIYENDWDFVGLIVLESEDDNFFSEDFDPENQIEVLYFRYDEEQKKWEIHHASIFPASMSVFDYL